MTTMAPVSCPIAAKVYRPELDALRFFAFLAVYVCHAIPAADARAGWLAGIKDAGNFGVCLFFLLSAYLITDLLLREREQFGTVHVCNFYVRRILRIWPLYFGTTLVYAVAGPRFHAFWIEPGRVAAYFLLAGNWYIALHPWIQTPLRALWSISVEEQFYLVWPVLGKAGGRRAFATASIAIVPLSFMSIAIVSNGPFAFNTVWLNSFVQFLFFSAGALLAVGLRGNLPRLQLRSRAGFLAGGLCFCWLAAAVAMIKRPAAHVTPLQFCCGYLLVALGCISLFLAAAGISEDMVPRWMIYLGKISFGLYVFHETAFLLVDEAQKHIVDSDSLWLLIANKIVALVLTIFLAALSYHFFESPFLRLKQRFARIPSRSI